MLKRVLSVLLALMLMLSGAMAENALISFEEYAQMLAGEDSEAWKAEKIEEIQVLTIDEGVVLSVCLWQGEMSAITIEANADSGLVEYASMALEPLGVLDEETLAALEELPAGESLAFEGWLVGRIAGETREGVFFCEEGRFEELVWQPMHGGKKQHNNPNCSGMDIPRLITEDAAENAGYDRCKRCDWPDDEP